MIHLDNSDITQLLSMKETMDALRIGYEQLSTGDAAHVPRLELWSPAAASDAYHCLGTMSGSTKHHGFTSDVMRWPDGKSQEKYAIEPGTYCGFILLFSAENGEPVALINDGILQQTRVGGSAGIATDALANPGLTKIGIIGSGNMARTYLEAISLTRPIEMVKVFSPNKAHRALFATEMSDRLRLNVRSIRPRMRSLTAASSFPLPTRWSQHCVPNGSQLDPWSCASRDASSAQNLSIAQTE